MVFYPGPIPLGNESYVERSFETRVLSELFAQRWVLLLGPRQHGKTSALLRMKRKIEEADLRCIYIDLQRQSPGLKYADLINWFGSKTAEQVGATFTPNDSVDDLAAIIRLVLPDDRRRVIFLIDEASNIRDDAWRNAFYGQLRGFHSSRAFADENDVVHRVCFLFCGTFRPETLIDEGNSPFNICERIETDDLSREQVRTLVETALSGDVVDLATGRIYDAVGGQPYLVQRILGRTLGAEDVEVELTAAIEELLSGTVEHISNLFGRILSEGKLVDMVSQLARDSQIPNAPADPDCSFLCTSGISKRDGGYLIFRNNTYREVARASPQFGNVATTSRVVAVFPLPIDNFQKLRNEKLREIAFNAQRGAVAAYQGDCYRIALAGYGCSIEAVLMDFLSQKTEADLTAARTASNCKLNQFEAATDPSSWRLVNLIKAANHFFGHVDNGTEALREWRNLIHPKLALSNYRDDAEFEPEVRAAAAMHEIFLRDLPQP